jgi:3-oxoacyl-[acyl-carrier-protein] synthase III
VRGFLFALVTADRFVRSGKASRVLVAGGEVYSTALEMAPRAAAVTPIFGDGAGVAIVGAGERPGILGAALHSDPTDLERFWCEFPASRHTPARMDMEHFAAGDHFYRLDAGRVHAQAARSLAAATREALEHARVGIDRIALHVVNYFDPRVAQTAIAGEGVPDERILATAEQAGHLGAAGIPSRWPTRWPRGACGAATSSAARPSGRACRGAPRSWSCEGRRHGRDGQRAHPRRRTPRAGERRHERRPHPRDGHERRVDPAAHRHPAAPLRHRGPGPRGSGHPRGARGARRGEGRARRPRPDSPRHAVAGHRLPCERVAAAAAPGRRRDARDGRPQQCSGFLYMLATADAFIRSGAARHVLVVGAETHSTGLDLSTEGREVGVIFGDGAGAVVLGPEPDPKRGILSTHLHSEGKYAEKLMVEPPSSRVMPRVSPDMLTGPGSRLWPRMEGRYVFKHAVTRFTEVINEALDANGLTAADIDLLIPHQANLRISQLVAMGFELPEERVFNNIQRYGNTTAASIPIALYEARKEGRVPAGSLTCLAAFGAGFTWGAALVRW